jgi:hypothetical protein
MNWSFQVPVQHSGDGYDIDITTHIQRNRRQMRMMTWCWRTDLYTRTPPESKYVDGNSAGTKCMKEERMIEWEALSPHAVVSSGLMQGQQTFVS